MKNNSLQKKIGLFFLFWIAALVFYLPTAGAGFVTDQVTWMGVYEKIGWKGIFTAFDDVSLHYTYHFAGFVLWRIFGLNGYGYLFVFITLHSLNALLSCLIFNKLFSNAGIKNSFLIAIAGSLLFLLSPYQTEPLCWYACIHYPLTLLLVLLSFQFFTRYIETGDKRNIIFFYLLYAVSLFSLELSFSFPLILLVFIAFFPLDNFKENKKLKLFTWFVLPSLFCVAAYFALNKLILGNLTGHYGASVHFNFSIPLIIGNLLRYSLKIFGLTQFLPYNVRDTIYTFAAKQKVAYAAFVILILAALLAIIYKNRITVKWRITGILFACYILGLSVILNLYFTYLTLVEGDRLSYFATLFAGQLIAFFLVAFFKKTGWVLLTICFLFNCYFLFQNTHSWAQNKEVRTSLEQSFKWYNAKKIFILNLPDNYKGTYMYRDSITGQLLAQTLKFKTGKDISDKLTIICNFNMETIGDSVKVNNLAADSLKVEFAQYGNWWWTSGRGANLFTNSDYTLYPGEWNINTVRFKHLEPGDVILYQCGKVWRQVK